MTKIDIQEIQDLRGRLKHELEQQISQEEFEDEGHQAEWEADRANEQYFENRGPEPIQGIDY